MKISMYEACAENDRGSIGAWYVAEHARRAGYMVDVLQRPHSGYDVELVSVHHCMDFERLARLPKHGKIRIVGGHPTANNPRPIIPFADVVCVGEAESWIGEALRRIEAGGDVDSLTDMPGTIISKNWKPGDEIPKPLHEKPLPDNPPYLNRPGTRSAAWYVEIARGCPYSCAFCELGHSMPFRLYRSEHLKMVLEKADTSITRKINFYAPDECSHPDYEELFSYLKTKGYSAGFSSMRVDSILRRGLPDMPMNMLVRVGVDGLTEETRKRVSKKITDDMIVEYFDRFIQRGHVQYKMFFIIGYPWEEVDDFKGFERLMRRLFRLNLKKNISLRLKWTPFIPQPCTPLKDAKAKYSHALVRKINIWHAINARPRRQPGWYIENDGLMSAKTHKRQRVLTAGSEWVLLRFPGSRPLHEIGGNHVPIETPE
jgi:radical SAM superfamily enzyme YgiQ (UPF0313 family)